MDEQDMRKMGNLINYLPITYVCFVIGSLSLMAFPFLTGFYSKDFILEILFIPHNTTDTIAYLLTLIAAFLTSIYSIRLLILTFLSKPHFNNKLSDFIKDPLDFPTLVTLIILTLGAIFFGYLSNELFVGGGTEVYMNSIFTHPNNFRLFDSSLSEFTILKLIVSLPLIFIVCL
jgi:NADH-ubiquinone oxidoreductase chain 5